MRRQQPTFKTFISRENEIFDILQKFLDEKLEFVVVGGYAVSAYKHRFSMDADIVLKGEHLQEFAKVLEKNKFAKTITKELENIYSSRFMRFEKRTELPATVDVLIDGMASRQTGAAFSYELLKSNSELRTIKGIEKEIRALVPRKEILIVLKLHAGRGADLRDVAALSRSIDMEFIQGIIKRGDTKLVKENINRLLSLLEDKGFMDSFKGVFIEKRYDLDVEEVRKLGKIRF